MVRRAAAQKVDWLANFRSHPDRLAAACTVFLGPLAASGAWAARDAVLHPSAARFLATFLELVRDSPSAAVEKSRQDVLPARQPLVAQ